jgi:hypothetical protein
VFWNYLVLLTIGINTLERQLQWPRSGFWIWRQCFYCLCYLNGRQGGECLKDTTFWFFSSSFSTKDTTFWFFSSSFSTSFSIFFLCLLQLQPDKVKRLMTVSNGKLLVWVVHHFPYRNKCYFLYKPMFWTTLFWYACIGTCFIYVWGVMYKWVLHHVLFNYEYFHYSMLWLHYLICPLPSKSFSSGTLRQ